MVVAIAALRLWFLADTVLDYFLNNNNGNNLRRNNATASSQASDIQPGDVNQASKYFNSTSPKTDSISPGGEANKRVIITHLKFYRPAA